MQRVPGFRGFLRGCRGSEGFYEGAGVQRVYTRVSMHLMPADIKALCAYADTQMLTGCFEPHWVDCVRHTNHGGLPN
jgi:hypothetical protein